MNVKRFSGKTSRDALNLVRKAFGEDAVVLSTKPTAAGVDVLAMAPESLNDVERLTASKFDTDGALRPMASRMAAAPAPAAPRPRPAAPSKKGADMPAAATGVAEDAERLSMSTLSFQDYVRDRMLKRRQAALNAPAAHALDDEPMRAESMRAEPLAPRVNAPASAPARAALDVEFFGERSGVLEQRMAEGQASAGRPAAPVREPRFLHDEPVRASEIHAPGLSESAHARRDQDAMMRELRSMKGLIEERFGALAFMEKLQRQPGQARLTQKLLDCGLSPALIRKLSEGLTPDVVDETAWAANILEHNLLTGEGEPALEDRGGVYTLVGATGVGKTTTTAKIAAAFATKYGASNLGLITLDAYRIGAHEQLRTYGRILGVPVHTAHDRASLEDLLELLTGKKMVLIDTAGMAQRDSRTRELLEMLSHRSIQKLLVINAASQGETIEDVVVSYGAATCAGIVLSKMDEAVKLGPALDTLIRRKLKVVGVANGQRVPEDWHRLSSSALVARALRGGGSSAYRLDASDVSLVFTSLHGGPAARASALA